MPGRNRIACLLVALVAFTMLTACGESPTAPSNYAAYSQTDLVLGTGADVTSSSAVTVTYTGWYFDPSGTDNKGLMFDSNVGGTPYSVTLGAGTVIAGWEKGLVGMKAGGTRRLVIPPSLAYGSSRFGAIPPSATLVFEVTVLTVS